MITAPNFSDLERMGLVHGFGERTSIYPEGIRTAKQIHSDIVQDAAESLGEGDALISNRAGILVGIKTADCVPILIVDPSTHAVAAIHAGWRGTARGITVSALRSMCERWKTKTGDVIAAIGPAIGVCCYEVGPEVARQFGVETPSAVHLNLAAINEMQLRHAGVKDIWQSGQCTFCAASRFFSYRREKEHAGRMISFIGWTGTG